MPNSDGSTAINCISSAEPPSETNGSAPLQNGIHNDDEGDTVHVNGESSPPGINGVDKDDTNTTSEASEVSSVSMKLIRKRTSDTEILHEGSKKSKLSANVSIGDAQSPQTNALVESSKEEKDDEKVDEKEEENVQEKEENGTDTDHHKEESPKEDNVEVKEENGIEVEKEEEEEEEKTTEKPNISSNGNIEEKPTPPGCDASPSSSSASIILVEDTEENSQTAPDKAKSETSSNNNDAVKTDMNVEEEESKTETEEVNQRSKEEEKEEEEEEPVQETNSDAVVLPSKSDDTEAATQLRDSILKAYNRQLKQAVTCSITSLHRITSSLSTHNNNWQSKYHDLHNRFLHLKVCTDKMVESTAKDGEKQSRSVEAQTDEEFLAPAPVNPSAPITPNQQRQQSVVAGAGKITGPASVTQNDTNGQLLAAQSQTQQSGIGAAVVALQQQPLQNKQQQPPQQLVIVSPNAGGQALPRARLLATIATQSGANVIDLTEDDGSAQAQAAAHSLRTPGITITPPRVPTWDASGAGDQRIRHPMPLPCMSSPVPSVTCKGLPPPSPYLTVSPAEDGVCLKWNIPNLLPNVYSKLKRYRLFNYSKTPQSVFFSFQNPWKEIGSVDSMDLPMACTLTQIQSNSVYYFAIRPVDEYERLGIWSNTATIELAAVDS